MVRVRVIPPQRLADPLAVGVAAATLIATHALVVQHGVDVHGALLALQSSLGGGTQQLGLNMFYLKRQSWIQRNQVITP